MFRMLTLNDDDKFKINTRELFEQLSTMERHPDWFFVIKNRYRLQEGKDYITVKEGLKKTHYTTVAIALNIAQNSQRRSEDIVLQLIDMQDESDKVKYIVLRKEYQFGELLNTTVVNDWESQYNVDGYRLDFYSAKYNLIIEFDEEHHRYQSQQDVDRMDHILNYFDDAPHVIRVAESEELQGLKEINKYINDYQKQNN